MSSNSTWMLDNQSFYGIRFFEFRRIVSFANTDKFDWKNNGPNMILRIISMAEDQDPITKENV